MPLQELLRPELIFPDLRVADRAALLRALAERLAEQGAVRRAGTLYERLAEREALGSTAVGAGVAIPHCKLEGLPRVVVAVATCAEGVDFEAEDGEAVRLVFLVVSPADAPADHLRSLAAISRWIKETPRIGRLLELHDAVAVYRALGGGEAA